jgi:hypothetical protein
MRPTAGLILMTLLGTTPVAWADGGTVRASERCGEYRVTVFTAPTPLVVGPADVSVLVQDAAGRPLPDLPVSVTAWPAGAVQRAVESAATTDAATNKLLRAAMLPLEEAGPWVIEVTADLPHGQARVRCSVEVGEPPPSWLELLPWVGWPLLLVLVFAVRELLSRPRPAAASGS